MLAVAEEESNKSVTMMSWLKNSSLNLRKKEKVPRQVTLDYVF
jgi:hypothetical protein